MRRKIIKQGHNTLTITLPTEWVRKFNLKAGSEVDILDRENGLFISTEKNGENKRASFDITDMDIPTIWKYFMAVYREGYDEVLVKFPEDIKLDNPYKFLTHHKLDIKYGKQKRETGTPLWALQEFTNRFIGYEIVEHGKDYILIRDMGELTSKQFDNSMRKVFLLLQEMGEETLEAIQKCNTSTLTQIHDVDVTLDKFHDYCIRILNKTSNKEPRKSELLFSILYLLELIGDEFKNISNHMIHDFPKSKFSNIKEFAEITKQQIDVFYDLFYKFDKEKITKMSDLDKHLFFKLLPEVYEKSSDKEKEIYHHLRIISRYLNALLELRIEMEF